ncbi:hypothetical protein TRIUR3_04180 [Triticum urartu]|uniref:Uncharacterized protein n=1 Tax=Triticum urartu TaxID=4572 RepID=M8ADQ4_TRIUA|nr:hypothetical protein TRIUR3_04180 [Triticum urartu]
MSTSREVSSRIRPPTRRGGAGVKEERAADDDGGEDGGNDEKVLSGEECLGPQCLRAARSAWANTVRKSTSSASRGGMVASAWAPGRGGVPGCGERCLGKERARRWYP